MCDVIHKEAIKNSVIFSGAYAAIGNGGATGRKASVAAFRHDKILLNKLSCMKLFVDSL